MTYVAATNRYQSMRYRRSGRSGVLLPELSLGLWQNFGDDRPLDTQRAIVRFAFDRGITHFDLANNYGPPYGAAETNFGHILRSDLAPYRDELFISTKAGWDMWPGPYGDRGSRKYLLASLDQSLRRMGLDYVDVFYSHRCGPGHAARGDDGSAGRRRAPGEGPLRRGLLVLGPANRGGRADPARAGDTAAHSSALVLAAEPLDRGIAPRHARSATAWGASSSRHWLRVCSPTST